MVDQTQIENALRAVNPSVRLVRERHLLRMERELLDLAARRPADRDAPHRIDRQFAADLDLFPVAVTAGQERELLLFSAPRDRQLADDSVGDVLRHYWERLFAEAVAEKCRGAVGEFGAANRWEKLGPTVEREAEFLLKTTRKVPDDPTPEELYAAFAAEFARTFHFRPSALSAVFPMADRETVLAVIGADADLLQLLAATRPAGASDPRDIPLTHFPPPATKPAEHPHRADGYAKAADRAAALGNDAKAAILREKAALASSSGAARHYKAARESLAEHLVPRLANVLGWNADTRAAWVAALQPLLLPAAIGTWSEGAKALYDLQKVAIDLERELYAVDPASWLRSLGRRPMVRKLTLGRDVILLLHLKRVERHLAHTPLPEANRDALYRLLADEICVIDARVRGEIGPKMMAVFDRVGFVPTNPAEAVAREKVVQELLDLACERGQIRLGHLRDAVARNRLKMRDLAGPGEFFGGDVLLRADAELDRELDGVYVRGEVYLRAIQRGSALAFGTRTGRALSLFVFGPVIAAFLAVEFAKYIAHELVTVYRFLRSFVTYQDDPMVIVEGEDGEVYPAWTSELAAQAKHGIEIGPASLTAVAIVAVVVLGLIHSPPFRRAFGQGLLWVWRAVVWVVSLPVTIWRSPPAMAVRRNRKYRWVARRLGLAVTLTAGTALFLWLFGASAGRIARFSGFTFAITALFVNSWVGRWFTEETTEVLSETWRRVRVNFLANVLGWIVWLFSELLAAIDRMLYAVDEWLRFRAGQSKPSLWLKVIVGVIWFPIAYILRFVIYLFIEPQINPVKHFPVVTVSHKLLLPLIPTLAPTVAEAFTMSYDKAFGVLTVIIGCIPGMFGFIAWELKENWRLYAANRPKRLGPVSLGHHGESMRGLLRPGFHSGTIPAYFKKVRAAVRHADERGQPAAVGKYLDGLHHVEHAIQMFIERELVAVLHRAHGWERLHLEAGHARLSLQCVEVEVVARDFPKRPAVFSFTHKGGVISGRVTEPGFTTDLTPDLKEAWDTAAVGLLAMAAVEVPPEDNRVEWSEWTTFWAKREAK